MNSRLPRLFRPVAFTLPLGVSLLLLCGGPVQAQCPELASGLRFPLGITQSNQDNLIVSEAGTLTANTGRISVVDLTGRRRTLLDGLPSGRADVGDPSGPAGLFMRGRTLYVAIGVGDVGIAGPVPGTVLVNPDGPSSPLFSSVLAMHFSAHVEQTTEGFALTLADQDAIAAGKKVTLKNSAGEKMTVQRIANFPNYESNPIPAVPGNIRVSNPFDLVVVDDQAYVTDGGMNMVRQVDIPTGAFSVLAFFSPIPNPVSGFGPVLEAVPTGIRYVDGQLLVTLFRGVPFPPGWSQVQSVDPVTGAQAEFITGLKTAIDVLRMKDGEYLVLQHASTGLFFGSPGLVLGFETPSGPPTTVANCLTQPTSMVLDEKTGTLHVTELGGGGRVVSIGGL